MGASETRLLTGKWRGRMISRCNLLKGTLIAGLLLCPLTAFPNPSDREEKALAQLDAELDGAVVYTRKGRIRKVVLGEWKPKDLGPGEYARWSADGKRIAVWDDEQIFVMNADGSNRKLILKGAVKEEDGSPIEFHTNNREVLYCKRDDGLWTVDIQTGKTRKMDLPGEYTGEPGISADGKRMVARWGNDLFAIDPIKKTHRKYGVGCSPAISPDGKRIMNNVGSHRQIAIRNWDGQGEFRVDTRTCRPDREWDDHHWSNHNDYVTGHGEDRGEESYVVKVSENRVTRVTWEGDTDAPDLYVARAKG